MPLQPVLFFVQTRRQKCAVAGYSLIQSRLTNNRRTGSGRARSTASRWGSRAAVNTAPVLPAAKPVEAWNSVNSCLPDTLGDAQGKRRSSEWRPASRTLRHTFLGLHLQYSIHAVALQQSLVPKKGGTGQYGSVTNIVPHTRPIFAPRSSIPTNSRRLSPAISPIDQPILGQSYGQHVVYRSNYFFVYWSDQYAQTFWCGGSPSVLMGIPILGGRRP